MLDFHIRDRVRSGFEGLTSPSRDSETSSVPPITPSPLVSTSGAQPTAKLPQDLSSRLAASISARTNVQISSSTTEVAGNLFRLTANWGEGMNAFAHAISDVMQQEVERQRQQEANNQERLVAMEGRETAIKQREEELARRQDEEARRQQEILRQTRLALEEQRRQELIRQEQERLENQRRLQSIYQYQNQYQVQMSGQQFERQQNRTVGRPSPFQAAFSADVSPWNTRELQQGFWGFVAHNQTVSSVRPVSGSPGLYEVTYTDRGTRQPSTEVLSSSEIATRFPGHARTPQLEAKANDAVTWFGNIGDPNRRDNQTQGGVNGQRLQTQLLG